MSSAKEVERAMSQVGQGRLAALAFQHFQGVLSAERDRILGLLKLEYRSGSLDPAKMGAHIGAVCALDDIESKLKRQINQSQELEREILNNEA